MAAKPQSLPVSRLWPSEVIWAAPEQLENTLPLPTVLEATIEFCTETVVVEAARIPPAFVVVVPPSLAVIVELVIVAVLVQRVHRLQMAPAPASALLLTRVELSTVRCPTADPVPVLSIPPAVPPPLDAKLRLSSTRECVSVSVPPTFAMPPPEPPVV